MDAHSKAESVENRHGGQHLGVMDFLGGHVGGLPCKGVEVKVTQHYTLGGAGGAAGEEDNGLCAIIFIGHIVIGGDALPHCHEFGPGGVAAVFLELRELPFREEFLTQIEGELEFVGDPAHDELFDGAKFLYLKEFCVELVKGYGNLAAGLVHVEGKFRHCRKRMHHCRDGPYAVESVKAKYCLRHVGKAHEHPLAGLYAKGVETLCNFLYFLSQARIAGGFPHEGEGREVFFAGCRVKDGAGHCFFAVVKFRCNATVTVCPRCGNVVNLIFHGFSLFQWGWKPEGQEVPVSGRFCGEPLLSWKSNSRRQRAHLW